MASGQWLVKRNSRIGGDYGRSFVVRPSDYGTAGCGDCRTARPMAFYEGLSRFLCQQKWDCPFYETPVLPSGHQRVAPARARNARRMVGGNSRRTGGIVAGGSAREIIARPRGDASGGGFFRHAGVRSFSAAAANAARKSFPCRRLDRRPAGPPRWKVPFAADAERRSYCHKRVWVPCQRLPWACFSRTSTCQRKCGHGTRQQ